ncbi:peroxiredoxin [bacterium F11]|nr:peroxiredoxin [bacterium F11]
MKLFNWFNKKAIAVGDEAPDFELASSKGGMVRLSDFRNKKHVVLYFYPKDNTTACIAESCGFRDQYDEFLKAGADIVGISSDTVESHIQFSEKYQFPFHLLADKNHQIRERYGVPPTLGLLPGRTTYLIDKKGIVQYLFNSQFHVDSHITLTLQKLKSMTMETPKA